MSTLRVTIRDGACIEYLRDRKKRGFPFSLSVTDVLIEHLERKASEQQRQIHIYMREDGPSTQPSGGVRGQVHPAGGKPIMQALLTELKTVFEGVKKKRMSE